MKTINKATLSVAAMFLAAAISFAEFQSEVLWLDFDMKNIPEPKERSEAGFYDYFFKGQLMEGTKQQLDVPRWIRRAADNPKEASNVNALDEVPNSSWYTNRHHLRRLSKDELQQGPNRGNTPDFSRVIVTKAKPAGVTPGMMVKDAHGDSYLIKFDGFSYPNQRSGAEVISTKIMYAAGYNVPENYISYIDRKSLNIDSDVEITDENTRKKRQLTNDDIDVMLRRVAAMPDGRYRVLASKIIKGKAKGPFTQVGLRTDDPNDVIPHEHRRELRALRVISSWINNWDLKEGQSLDLYVEEDGRKFLRHYLIDFGASLGAAVDPTEYFHGHEYGFDLTSITKEIFSLGIHRSGNEKRALIISPEVGSLTAAEFHPGKWKPSFPSVMFSNLTDLDAFWAARVILSFREEDLRGIVETAEYSLPTTNNYVVRTLMERRRMVANYWLGKVDALSDFSLERAGEGVVLKFRDLILDEGFVLADAARYTYQVRRGSYTSEKKLVRTQEIRMDADSFGIAGDNGGPVEVRIWAHRRASNPEPVKVYFEWSPGQDKLTIRRISRG